MEQIIPTLDLKVLQEKTDEAAMKGATECINQFYNEYNSIWVRIQNAIKK